MRLLQLEPRTLHHGDATCFDVTGYWTRKGESGHVDFGAVGNENHGGHLCPCEIEYCKRGERGRRFNLRYALVGTL